MSLPELTKGLDFVGVTVSYFCHDGKGNYVFQKRGSNCRDEHDRWDGGGGGLEFEDSVIDTLHKEIREEYAVDVISYEFLGYRDVRREQKGKNTHWISLDFRVEVDRAKVINAEPHKFTEIGWFRMDALPAPMHSQFSTAFAQYKDRLV